MSSKEKLEGRVARAQVLLGVAVQRVIPRTSLHGAMGSKEGGPEGVKSQDKGPRIEK